MRFFFHIERLAAQRQDGLRLAHACLLGRTARRIALDDEQLVQFRFFARTGGELADEGEAVDGVLGAGDFLGLPSRAMRTRARPLRLFDDLFEDGLLFRVGKEALIPSTVAVSTGWRASALPSLVLVCPSNCTFFILMERMAVSPSRKSSPSRFASFSFKAPRLRATSLRPLVSPVRKPVS